MPSKITTDQFIVRSTGVHGEKYDYSIVDYKSASTNISIICKTHGVFQQMARLHMEGRGCQKCSKEAEMRRRKLDNTFYTKRQLKTEQTLLDRYSVKNVSHLDETKLKISKSNTHQNKIRGVEITLKRKTTNLSRYGTESSRSRTSKKHQNESLNRLKQGLQQYLNKHNVINVSQIPEIHKKQQDHRKTNKKYKFSDGINEYNVQGFEPFALEMLEHMGYSECDICLVNRPTFKFMYDGISRRYYPDIYIPTRNLIIEVKSDWTLSLDKKIDYKIAAVESSGLSIEVWVMGKHQLLYKYYQTSTI